MTKTNYHLPLQPDGLYHITSRAIGSEQLFCNNANQEYLLNKYLQHVAPVADTYAWCLLPNHFHMLIHIRSAAAVTAYYGTIKKQENVPVDVLISDFIMERFSNWLNAYTKAFNKVYNRKGSLFIDYMRRVAITSDNQLAATLFYIHRNPIHHGYATSIYNWYWSSYQEYCHRQYRYVSPFFVQNFFGTLGAFKQFHAQPANLKDACMLE